MLRKSDAEWVRLRPMMKAKDDATFRALRDAYRGGIPERWGAQERDAARRLFAILAEQGGEKLVGRSETLQDGTFWPDFVY
jgi:NitT/TauT family transport system substrate-binding protein